MAQRLIQVVLSARHAGDLDDLLVDFPVRDRWDVRGENKIVTTLLLSAGGTEAMCDTLEQRFAADESLRILLLPVEAALPRPEETPQLPPEAVGGEENEQEAGERDRARVSRAELLEDLEETCRVSPVFLVMVALSTVVATVGLLRDNVAVVIGAMVIAPLLGPNVALALATTLGDGALARRALRTNVTGAALALLLSIAFGAALDVDAAGEEVHARTEVRLSDAALALSSGVAGCLAFTAGVSTALVGVMVAVALLPPLAVFGLLVGSGAHEPALGALLLLVTNLICINLAGVVTFMVQGIRPRTWWEADRARRATRIAVAVWVLLLAALSGVVIAAFGL